MSMDSHEVTLSPFHPSRQLYVSLHRSIISPPPVRCPLNAILFTSFSEVAGCGLHCAHWATTVLSWGPSEHRDHTSYLAISFRDRALREHRRSSGSIPSSLPRFFPYSPSKGGLVDPL